MKIIRGDCIEIMSSMDAKSVHTCVTSPPYFGLRDYGCDDQIGLEPTPEEYVNKMVDVFREVRRVLRDDGTLWLNLGDSYAGSGKGAWDREDIQKEVYVPKPAGPQTKCKTPGLKPKNLIGIPWRVAFALQADGWYLRQDIIWHKPNTMPESVADRCTKAHEYIFLLSKSQRYYYDNDAIAEEGASDLRNKRSVWTINTKPYKGAHFATFPPDLIQPCIKAGCPEGGTVLDPFMGSGTTIMVAEKNGCNGVGIELNADYIKIASDRLADCRSLFGGKA
jgi:DNA modification methylase